MGSSSAPSPPSRRNAERQRRLSNGLEPADGCQDDGSVAGPVASGCVAAPGLSFTSTTDQPCGVERPPMSAPSVDSVRTAAWLIFAGSVHLLTVFVSNLVDGMNPRLNAACPALSITMNTRFPAF